MKKALLIFFIVNVLAIKMLNAQGVAPPYIPIFLLKSPQVILIIFLQTLLF
jgi:hypothetical protein